MALTNAEKVKRYRERLKKKEKEAARAIAPVIFRRPFFEFFERHGTNSLYSECLDTAGIEAPDFSDDSPPRSFSGEIEAIFESNPDGNLYNGLTNSLAKAELIIGQLIDAAAALAETVNDYKRSELDQRIAEIEQADLSDAEVRKKAFADMARLKKMRDQLDKQVRWTFPQWQVTGD